MKTLRAIFETLVLALKAFFLGQDWLKKREIQSDDADTVRKTGDTLDDMRDSITGEQLPGPDDPDLYRD